MHDLHHSAHVASDWLVGGARMGALIRSKDWSKTALGPLATWPSSLRLAVNLCLNSRFPMFVWWGPNHINIYNDGYVPMLGQRHPAALGRPARDSWDDIWDVVGPQADAVMLRGEATWNERVRLVMERNGFTEETYFTWSYSPIYDETGVVVGLFCAVTEETERVRTDQLLAAQTRALELVAGGAPLPEALGALVKVVEEQSNGHSVASILLVDEDGCSLRTGAAPSLPPEYNAAIDGIKAERDVGTCADAAARNAVVCTPDLAVAPSWNGLSQLPLSLGLKAAWSMPICSADGRVLGTFGTYFRERREPTIRERQVVAGLCRVAALAIERRHAEVAREELLTSERAARSDAERASRMKDEFLATLSHELRTPLNAILGWSQILATGSADDQDLAEGLRTIERNARAQTQIIEDLLDMSRIISGKVRLNVQQIKLGEVVEAAIETVRPAANAKGIHLQVQFDTILSPTSGDPNRLQQVFWNLLTNAVKFTPRDGRVRVRLQRVNSHIEVSITDTGEGINRDFLPYVFDRFRQADASSTRKHGGLGLGLAIVKQLVELHGGTVRVESDGEGQGTTFTVNLPVTAVNQEPAEPAQRLQSQIGEARLDVCDGHDRIAGLRVLVVDDEADARVLIKRLLEECHVLVTVAGSADEAMERISTEKPDVLVSDIGMPREDGYSLIRRVRALSPDQGGNVPAVALTAYARTEDRMKAVAAGYQMHVVKPVEPAQLVNMVATLAGRKGQI